MHCTGPLSLTPSQCHHHNHYCSAIKLQRPDMIALAHHEHQGRVLRDSSLPGRPGQAYCRWWGDSHQHAGALFIITIVIIITIIIITITIIIVIIIILIAINSFKTVSVRV